MLPDPARRERAAELPAAELDAAAASAVIDAARKPGLGHGASDEA
ncbi:hypothetical protein ACQEVY_07755 [Streptomyces sp. CA-288835]